MVSIVNYCPMIGCACPKEPVDPQPNTYFLIQPFDDEKKKREKAVKRALDMVYCNKNYEIKKSDVNVNNIASYCDICIKIKSSQNCIADISGEVLRINAGKSKIKKAFLRPNVAFELGLAYGFNKPSFILSRELDGHRQIPSDINFIRYIDVPFNNWSSATKILADRLKKRNIIFSPESEPLNSKGRKSKNEVIKFFESLIHLKENYSHIRTKHFTINFISYVNNSLIGIIKRSHGLKEGICFRFFIKERGIEIEKCYVEVFHIQPNEGFAQVVFHGVEISDIYWKKIVEKTYYDGENYVLDDNRLELVVPEFLEGLSIEEMRHSVDLWNRIT